MKTYRVLIADDHPLARQAVRTLLEDEAWFQIVGEARGGREAVEKCGTLEPDLVLIDIRMPDLSGLEATRLIKQQHPGIKVVVLSVSDSVQDLFSAIQYGAQGYLLKDMEPSDWLAYLHALLEDDPDVSRRMADKLFHRFKSMPAPPGHKLEEEEFDRKQLLTAREQEIAAYAAAGATNRQIAESLVISEHTVKNHMKSVLDKLGLDNRVQLAAVSIRMGWKVPGEERSS